MIDTVQLKLCALCATICALALVTCPACGEASWSDPPGPSAEEIAAADAAAKKAAEDKAAAAKAAADKAAAAKAAVDKAAVDAEAKR